MSFPLFYPVRHPSVFFPGSLIDKKFVCYWRDSATVRWPRSTDVIVVSNYKVDRIVGGTCLRRFCCISDSGSIVDDFLSLGIVPLCAFLPESFTRDDDAIWWSVGQPANPLLKNKATTLGEDRDARLASSRSFLRRGVTWCSIYRKSSWEILRSLCPDWFLSNNEPRSLLHYVLSSTMYTLASIPTSLSPFTLRYYVPILYYSLVS